MKKKTTNLYAKTQRLQGIPMKVSSTIETSSCNRRMALILNLHGEYFHTRIITATVLFPGMLWCNCVTLFLSLVYLFCVFLVA